jgi:hypothetical protein
MYSRKYFSLSCTTPHTGRYGAEPSGAPSALVVYTHRGLVVLGILHDHVVKDPLCGAVDFEPLRFVGRRGGAAPKVAASCMKRTMSTFQPWVRAERRCRTMVSPFTGFTTSARPR